VFFIKQLGESWEECAAREVKEETNITTDNLKFIHVTNDPNMENNPHKHYVTIFMAGLINTDSSALNNNEPDKCEGWSWITWCELLDMYHANPDEIFASLAHLIDSITFDINLLLFKPASTN
jgi:ADP-ribose pyrophosphatase YjhB (NUDIX family)